MVIFFWFILEVSLEVASQILSTLIYGLSLEATSCFGALVGSLMLVCILVHNKWRVLVGLYRILSVSKFVNSSVNLNISYSLILILVTTVPARNTCLWVASGACLPHSFEHVILCVSLSCGRFPRDVSHLEVSTWFWAITGSSDSLFSGISMRSLIWIFGCRNSLLNLVREFFVNDHRVVKAHIALLHAFWISFQTWHNGLWLVTNVLLIVAWMTSSAAHITHARSTVDNTWLRNSVTLTIL